MIERPKLVLLLTVLSITGLAVLYAYSASISPLEISIADIDKGHIGKLVSVEGMVTEVSSTSGGMVFFSIADLTRPGIVTVFMDGDVAEKAESMIEGDICRVSGIVEYYNGEPEILPSSEKDIELLQRGGAISPGPESLLSNPERFQGVEIMSSGSVSRCWEDHGNWTIIELSYEYSLVVKTAFPVPQGTYYDARGEIEYDEYHGWWYLDEL